MDLLSTIPEDMLLSLVKTQLANCDPYVIAEQASTLAASWLRDQHAAAGADQNAGISFVLRNSEQAPVFGTIIPVADVVYGAVLGVLAHLQGTTPTLPEAKAWDGVRVACERMTGVVL